MSIRKIGAIVKKQIKDTLKNKAVLIQFLMFPVLTVIMDRTVNIPDLPENYFLYVFAAMYVGMAPLISAASIIAEEKEQNTLRVLMMSNVNASEYLIGEALYIVIACMIGSFVFALEGKFRGVEFLVFMGVMCIGIITSTVLGAAIGIWSKNQMAATSITVPVMIILSFVPMIAMFNEKVERFSQFLYTEQINCLIHNVTASSIQMDRIAVIFANALCAIGVFVAAYRKRGLLS
ncbi:MAG: ABC transporter permease [Velocimicrobium sp.]